MRKSRSAANPQEYDLWSPILAFHHARALLPERSRGVGILAYGGADDGGVLRTSTVERALAERPSGLTLSALTQRLGPMFDVGDALVVLRRRPDLFLKWDGLWMSRAASLNQEPRRLRWDFEEGSVPEEWRGFGNPSGAASEWRNYCGRMQETAFDPRTSHIMLTLDSGRHPGLRIHVDHTVLLDRAAWVMWTVTDDSEVAAALDAAGFFLWRQADPDSLVDVTHRVTLDGRPLPGPVLATWTLRTPRELAESLTFVLVRSIGVLAPRFIHERIDTVRVSDKDMHAFRVARRLWPRRRAGETIAHCQQCGNALTDPNSAALGYGPECAARLSLSVVRALTRGKDGVLFVGALPLTSVRERMRLETPATSADQDPL